MNRFLFINRKLMAWGNPDLIKELNENPEQGFWESFGWEKSKEPKKKPKYYEGIGNEYQDWENGQK